MFVGGITGTRKWVWCDVGYVVCMCLFVHDEGVIVISIICLRVLFLESVPAMLE